METYTIHVNPNREGLSDKELEIVNELRKQRDEAYNKSSEIQKQIDQIFIAHANFDQLIGKNIKIHFDGRDTYLIGIKEVNRLFYSSDSPKCRVTAELVVSIDDSGDRYFHKNYENFTINDSYQILTKEEVMITLQDTCAEIISFAMSL